MLAITNITKIYTIFYFLFFVIICININKQIGVMSLVCCIVKDVSYNSESFQL